MYDPEPSVRNNNEGSNLRSVAMPGNPLPVLSNNLNFRGEINDQNFYGHWSPQSNLNLNYGGCSTFSRDL